MRRREHRPISFGIFWFLGALAPTSLFVLSEVENDHRIFFPFVGLMLSVTWSAFLIVSRAIARHPKRRMGILATVQLPKLIVINETRESSAKIETKSLHG